MTVEVVQNRKAYTGPGDTFAITMARTDDSQIQVFIDTGTAGFFEYKLPLVDYTIVDDDVVLNTAITGSDTVLLIRSSLEALTQNIEIPFNDPIPSQLLVDFLDNFTQLAQEARDGAARSITSTDTDMPLPEAGKMLYGENGERTHKALSEIDGSAYTGPLAVADGGTGSATKAGARTNFGLGTAALKTAGYYADQVVLIGPGNEILPANLPEVSLSGAGVVRTLPVAANQHFVGGDGWKGSMLKHFPLGEIDQTSGTSHDIAGDSSWDAFPYLYLEGEWYGSAATTAIACRLDIDGTFQTGASDYIYSALTTSSAGAAVHGGTSSAVQLPSTVANSIPTSQAHMAHLKMLFTNIGATDDTYPARFLWQMAYVNSNLGQAYAIHGNARCVSATGPIRGIRLIMLTGTFPLLKARLYGLQFPVTLDTV